MNASLAKWIGDADALTHFERFGVPQAQTEHLHIRSRGDDFYIALMTQLFDYMRASDPVPASSWASIGNALAQFALDRDDLPTLGVSRPECVLLAAAAFYCGGFPASAYLVTRNETASGDELQRACIELLGRRGRATSTTVAALLDALRTGRMQSIARAVAQTRQHALDSLAIGPTEWMFARLLQDLVARFSRTNIRAVLPRGATAFWTPLVSSFLERKPPAWEFFPSQIEAIERGLLSQTDSFSLQMPTGAGKTAICETLLYWHAKSDESNAAVFLVPYRSLASELRGTVIKRLDSMGISSRTAYGGTVPSGDEVRALDDTQVIVATPESLSGLLSADPAFLQRVSLVICDEGHLLDGDGRGVGLELLLARFRARTSRPRFVFVSAIVPNIEQINAWLGGTDASVVRSSYRPALAEFAVLRPGGTGASQVLDLEMHPHEPPPTRFRVTEFLRATDFHYRNPTTRRRNTYPFGSVKTRAIAAARKALPLGTCAVFAVNKRGNQGAIGLAEELLSQLEVGIPLPLPREHARPQPVDLAVKYLSDEYGAEWVGTRALAAGAILHHGDIPQETREVVETLLRDGSIAFVVCTSTLAEGVNLPIRTLVLYSLTRREGRETTNLQTRDIKNLVGRAGRAGSTTKGLVICANEDQWPLLEQVALQAAGEEVNGALLTLLQNLQRFLLRNGLALTNELLERVRGLETLVDGVDATLLDLASEEIGSDALSEMAVELANQTFAWQQTDATHQALLKNVFKLRANNVSAIQAAGRITWLRETGARARLLKSVEEGLLPARESWSDVEDPLEPTLVDALLGWALSNRDLTDALVDGYVVERADVAGVHESFSSLVRAWLRGDRFASIATAAQLDVDKTLRVHMRAVAFALQTLFEQGIALLEKFLREQGHVLSIPVTRFPEHLRFGVPSAAGRILGTIGVRHRCALVALGCCGARLMMANAAAWLMDIGSDARRAPQRWSSQPDARRAARMMSIAAR